MNKELGKQLAHQLLMNTPALDDGVSDIKDCLICKQATWSQAGYMINRIVLDLSRDLEPGERLILDVQDVQWEDTEDILSSWDNTLKKNHVRHAGGA